MFSDIDLKTSLFLWVLLFVMGATFFYNRKTYLKQRVVLFAVLSIFRGLITLGVQPTLVLLGMAQVRGVA